MYIKQEPVHLLLTEKEAASYLGLSLKEFKEYKAELPDPVPCLPLNRKLRWSREELRLWAEHGCPLRCEWLEYQTEIRRREIDKCKILLGK